MKFHRCSGILLHPTSLPGRFGIGELGPEAYRFADFLADTKQGIWQVLPLGSTGYGDSPYQCFSAFAGNPLLVSLEKLVELGDLSSGDVAEDLPPFPERQVDFGWVIQYKFPLFRKAAENFRARASLVGQSQRVDEEPRQLVHGRVHAGVDRTLHEPHLRESSRHRAECRGRDGGVQVGIGEPVLL